MLPGVQSRYNTSSQNIKYRHVKFMQFVFSLVSASLFLDALFALIVKRKMQYLMHRGVTFVSK